MSEAWAEMLRRLFPLLAGLVCLAALLATRVAMPGPFERVRLAIFDSWQRVSPWHLGNSPVLVVTIDDESLARVGQWPWPRTTIASLVSTLQDAGAGAIGLDVIFAEPDRTSPNTLLRAWRQSGTLPRAFADLTASDLPNNDADFANALSRGRAVTAFALLPNANAARPYRASSISSIGMDIKPFLQGFLGAIPSLPSLEKAAAGQGSVSVSVGSEDVIRRLPLLANIADEIVPSLALETLRVAKDEDSLAVRTDTNGAGTPIGHTIRLDDLRIPINVDGSMWLHHGSLMAAQIIPAWHLLDTARVADFRDKFKNKIVLIGTSATGLGDLRPTPANLFEPGVNLHARAIEQMLVGHMIQRPFWMAGAEFLASILVALLIGLMCSLAGIRNAAVAFIVIVGATAGVSLSLFVSKGYLADPSLVMAGAFVAFLPGVVVRYVATERDGLRLRAAFTHYLSPDLVSTIAKDPSKLKLGGESREMTFLFTDLEGFTSLIERTDPEKAVALLNAYLEGLCGIAMRHGGTIDKIVGDALHLMFNAPLDQPDHATRAIRCALDIDKFANEFCEKQRLAGVTFGVTRIGVNTGLAVVGNFGGAGRFDYTAHGDSINTAARLEAVNKVLGTTICVARSTIDQTTEFEFRPVGILMLKGKSVGLEAFEPVSGINPDHAPLDDYVGLFEDMRQGRPEAATAMCMLSEAYPADPMPRFYARRINDGILETRVQT